MSKQRYKYASLILLIIVAGLLSRQTAAIPAATGDALYAMMMYFLVRFCFLKMKIRKVILASLSICFIIEFSQLYQAAWINDIRATLPGHLILGQGFLWSDLLAYIIAIATASLMDTFLKPNR